MDDIVHFMFRLEIDTGVVEILEDGTAGAALDGRQKVSFTISSGATAAYDARRWSLGKTKTSGSVRTRLQAKSSIWLLRPYESRIELAPHQGLGQRGGVITRQADFD